MIPIKIQDEPAQEQLDTLLDFYDIEVKELDKNEDADKAMLSALKKLKRYIMKGLVEINVEDGLKVIQNLAFSKGETKQIIYGVIDGKAKMAMSRAAETDLNGKIYQLMASLSNISADGLARLSGKDSSVVECLGAIFLMV